MRNSIINFILIILLSDIRIKNITKDISLTPIEVVMRDETPDSIRETASPICEAGSLINEPNFNIIVNLHPTEGTHWVLVIRREGGPVFYFDSFGVETPPLFLEEYVDLGSNERIQQYDESYRGAYCLYMTYLIDRGFRNRSALNILVNQCEYPRIYNECFCLGCNDNDKYNVNDNDNDNDNDLLSSFVNNVKDKYNNNDNVNVLRSSFANNVNDNVNVNDNDLRRSFANNVNVKDNDDVNDNDDDDDNDLRSSFTNNDNDNVNDLRCSFANNDIVKDNNNFIYQGTCLADLLKEKHGETSAEPVPGWTKSYGEGWMKSHQKGKPNNKECPANTVSININDDLQSWLNDDDIITEAIFPVNFRCIISGPSECGKTFLLKKLFLAKFW